MGDKINVAFLVDGSFLPINNGTDYSILTLMESLSRTNLVSPNLFLSWRGWDRPSLYYNNFFKTIFVPIDHFYNNDGVIEYATATMNISFIHIYNAEEVVNLANSFHRAGVKVIYEAVNVDYVLNSRLKADKTVIDKSKKLQARAMQCADFVMCRSNIDKNYIVGMGIDPGKVSVYRGAINVKAIPFVKRAQHNKKLVFMGHMYYPPNENALKYIARSILPNLKQIDEGYTVTILGSISKGVMRQYSDTDIIFKGNVEDIGGELSKYDMALAPLFEGSGTRLKILDYMASGLPVITTELGVEGLYGDIDKCVLVEDRLCNYAKQIHELINDKAKYNKYANDGRRYVESYYCWDNNLDPFLDIYNKLK